MSLKLREKISKAILECGHQRCTSLTTKECNAFADAVLKVISDPLMDLRVKHGFELVRAGCTVTMFSLEEMQAVVLRAIHGEFDTDIFQPNLTEYQKRLSASEAPHILIDRLPARERLLRDLLSNVSHLKTCPARVDDSYTHIHQEEVKLLIEAALAAVRRAGRYRAGRKSLSLAFRGESRLTIKERLINILANNGFHVDHIWVQHGDYRKARWDLAVWGADHVEFKGRSVSICSWSTMTEIVKAGGITWDQWPMHTSAGNQSNDIEIYPQAMKTAADLARAAREHTQEGRE